MSTWQLILVYVFGWAGCTTLGLLLASNHWQKRLDEAAIKSYNRGWNAGLGFKDRILDTRIDISSSVRILEGEPEE